MPKISVVVPVYGTEEYIERCARSLFEQTLDDIEYLFIDDCTPDHSIEVLQQVLEDYPQRKPQVVIHHIEQNIGLAAVRKWGMQNASGEYVIHCDSDDWVNIDMYRAMYEKAKEDGSDVVVCDYYIHKGSSDTYTKAFDRTDKKCFIEDMIAMRVSWAVWNKLVRRKRQETVYPEGAMGEDLVITIQNVLSSDKISFLRQPYYYYSLNPTSITQIKNKESIVKKYHEFLANSKIAISSLKILAPNENYKNAIVTIKWDTKRLLWQEVTVNSMFYKWKETYKEINMIVLLCPLISLSDKIKYIMTYMKLYPRH